MDFQGKTFHLTYIIICGGKEWVINCEKREKPHLKHSTMNVEANPRFPVSHSVGFRWSLRSKKASVWILFRMLLPFGTSLAVQWLRLRPSNAGGAGSLPGRGTRILYAVWRGQKIKNN